MDKLVPISFKDFTSTQMIGALGVLLKPEEIISEKKAEKEVYVWFSCSSRPLSLVIASNKEIDAKLLEVLRTKTNNVDVHHCVVLEKSFEKPLKGTQSLSVTFLDSDFDFGGDLQTTANEVLEKTKELIDTLKLNHH